MKLPENWTTNGRKGGSVTTHIITKQKKDGSIISVVGKTTMEIMEPF